MLDSVRNLLSRNEAISGIQAEPPDCFTYVRNDTYPSHCDAYTDVGGRQGLEHIVEDTERTEKKHENNTFIYAVSV